MKILHIATTDYGGAGRGMLNLHRALLSQGIDSKILVANKIGADDTIYQMVPNYQLFKWSRNRFVRKVQKVLRRRGKCQTVVEQWDAQVRTVATGLAKNICFTSPYTNYNVNQHPLVKDADVIHLHWIGNFIDYRSFFNGINKPVVWTLRDENPGLGGFHYCTDKMEFGDFYKDIETSFLETKKTMLMEKRNLTLIALSDEMVRFCKDVDFLSQKKIRKIYNPIDNGSFCAIDKKIARKALCLKEDSMVLSFASVSLRDHRKGLAELLEAIRLLNNPVTLLCMGKEDFFSTIPNNVICYGSVENSILQSLIYSASDAFVSPSRQESFGKTLAEALLCGVPVISTKVGVAPEVINESCGHLIENTNPNTIANAINEVSKKTFDRDCIRAKGSSLFDPIAIAKQHVEVYKEALEKQ